MYRGFDDLCRVLAVCDSQESSVLVLREAIGIASAHLPAELQLVTVAKRSRAQELLYRPSWQDPTSLEAIRAQLQGLAARNDLSRRRHCAELLSRLVLHVRVGEPAAEILRLSREIQASIIVLGCLEQSTERHPAWNPIFKTIMNHADCSVILVRSAHDASGFERPLDELPASSGTVGYRLKMHHYYL